MKNIAPPHSAAENQAWMKSVVVQLNFIWKKFSL